MFTIKAVEEKLKTLAKDLAVAGFAPKRMFLFGSYAKGTPREYSDLDVAVFADDFTGARVVDYPKVASILSRNISVELHPFHTDDTAEENPFIEEILHTGIDYSRLIPRN